MNSIISRLTHVKSVKTALASGSSEYMYIPDQELFNKVFYLVVSSKRHSRTHRFSDSYVSTLATYAMSPKVLPCSQTYLRGLLSDRDTITGKTLLDLLT